MTYAAAPMTTTAYATAAPQYTTVAAPVQYAAAPVQYAAAPVTTQVASYVAQPQPQYIQQVVAPAAPPTNLLEGIPTPAAIQAQKDGYAKALEKQYQDGAAGIAAETRIKKEMLAEQAKQQKAQYTLQVESQLQGQNLLLDQQMNSQLMMLQEAAMAQKSALEQQACALTLEYQQKKAEEEMLQKQFEIQTQYFNAETKLAAQFQKVTQDQVTPQRTPVSVSRHCCLRPVREGDAPLSANESCARGLRSLSLPLGQP